MNWDDDGVEEPDFEISILPDYPFEEKLDRIELMLEVIIEEMALCGKLKERLEPDDES